MAHVYHIPAWWPTTRNPFHGVFISGLIRAIAHQAPQHTHTVGVHHTELKWISLSHVFRDIRKYFEREIPLRIEPHSNVHVLVIQKTIGMNPKTGLQYIKSLIEKHKLLIATLPTKPDIIHVHVSYPALVIGHAIASTLNIPFVLTEHSSRFPDPRFEYFGYPTQAIRTMLEASGANIAVSALLANRFRQYGLAATKVIPNFVAWNKPDISARKSAKIFKFLIIGFMNDARKKVDIALKAIHQLVQHHSDFSLDVVGTGIMEEEYKNLATQLQIGKFITWHGQLSEPAKQSLLLHANCLVICSDYETFGITAIEAHSYGLPVISTECGGTEEIITPQNGKLVPKNDPSAMAQAMDWMIQHHSSYHSEDIQASCYEKYHRVIVAKQYLHVYQSVLLHHQ